MFEYTALVDAPVQRFTGIVTGSDEAETEPVLVSVVAPSPAAAAAAVEIEPPAPEPRAPVEPTAPVESTAPVAPIAPPAPAIRTFVPRPQPVHSPSASVVSALVGVAAAGITAMWWLRRDSHDRFR